MGTMSFEDALNEVDSGIIIDIEVTPGSKVLCVPSGYNIWRKRIEVRLSQNAQKGKANEQLISALADLFGMRSSEICFVNGMHNSKKSLLLQNAEYSHIIAVLKDKLPDDAV
ncbi:DUF167 domain-containing protein [Methanolobus sediminis]|uniref:UPF0235 protein RE474_08230 n=1 Tax=Methanolobus sediminis TaxID=3072978 RepID=A0AA51UN80_9EURY|nr:DUF167 domain-containing protein [Methanolobus sediminis]WMW26434.1 DUF167 domain-containing protein [Methanolobus sediminis]